MAEFDQFACNYTEILDNSLRFYASRADYFAEYKAHYCAELLGPQFHGKILDFGCGLGSVLSHLLRYLPHAVLNGYDVSSQCLRMIDSTIFGKVRFTDEISQVGFEYDLIMLAGVMHHIPAANHRQTITGLKKRLSPGGKLVIFEHNPKNFITRRIVNRCPFDKDATLVNMEQIGSYLQEAHLQVIRQEYIIFFPPSFRRLRIVERSLGWCALGAQYVVVSEKIENPAA